VEKAHDHSGKVFALYADAGMAAVDTGLIEYALQDLKLLRFEDAAVRRSPVHGHANTPSAKCKIDVGFEPSMTTRSSSLSKVCVNRASALPLLQGMPGLLSRTCADMARSR
jgi:hypothetical protein